MRCLPAKSFPTAATPSTRLQKNHSEKVSFPWWLTPTNSLIYYVTVYVVQISALVYSHTQCTRPVSRTKEQQRANSSVLYSSANFFFMEYIFVQDLQASPCCALTVMRIAHTLFLVSLLLCTFWTTSYCRLVATLAIDAPSFSAGRIDNGNRIGNGVFIIEDSG